VRLENLRTEYAGGNASEGLVAVLTVAEARMLLMSLQYYFEEADEGNLDPGWHTHIGSGDQELAIAIESEDLH
jgi:hypothetical protein